jgi:Na+:H+ antiporter, NhaA family
LSKKPQALIERMLRPIEQFARIESASGIVLLAMTIVALVIANSGLSNGYLHFLETPIGIRIGNAGLTHSLVDWVSDGLMVIFFFLVGLEIKREFISGELSNIKHAALPIFGALGGMVVPAAIFALFNTGTANSPGWGIPMATDIAFALGVVTLLGKRVPVALKIFLVALAIIDDIGAIVVIAIFYTSSIDLQALAIGLGLIGVLAFGNGIGVRSRYFYAVVGFVVWYAFLQSGVHATVAGVLVAFTVPTRHRINAKQFYEKCVDLLQSFIGKSAEKESILADEEANVIVREIEITCEQVQTPLSRFERLLGTVVAFVIMPVFVLTNAGVRLEGNLLSVFSGELGLGIILGLVLGKPVGIFLFAFLSSKLGLTKLPVNTSWGQLLAVGLLGGIGFTMSLFITGLAYTDPHQIASAKLSILVASVCASLLGWMAFSWLGRGGATK